MKFKAVIFDLDGTLANTLDTIHYYVQKTLEEFSLPPVTKEQTCAAIGAGAINLISGVLDTIGAKNADVNEVLSSYLKKYNAEPMYKTSAYDGINEALDELLKRGIKLGVLSNKPDLNVVQVVKVLFGDKVFSLTRGQIDGEKIKPDPEILFKMLDSLGVTAEETVFVGDTIVDMQTAKNAGAYALGVLWGFRDEDELRRGNADKIISHPSEIIELFED